jgi:hypothetical protein
MRMLGEMQKLRQMVVKDLRSVKIILAVDLYYNIPTLHNLHVLVSQGQAFYRVFNVDAASLKMCKLKLRLRKDRRQKEARKPEEDMREARGECSEKEEMNTMSRDI